MITVGFVLLAFVVLGSLATADAAQHGLSVGDAWFMAWGLAAVVFLVVAAVDRRAERRRRV